MDEPYVVSHVFPMMQLRYKILRVVLSLRWMAKYWSCCWELSSTEDLILRELAFDEECGMS